MKIRYYLKNFKFSTRRWYLINLLRHDLHSGSSPRCGLGTHRVVVPVTDRTLTESDKQQPYLLVPCFDPSYRSKSLGFRLRRGDTVCRRLFYCYRGLGPLGKVVIVPFTRFDLCFSSYRYFSKFREDTSFNTCLSLTTVVPYVWRLFRGRRFLLVGGDGD